MISCIALELYFLEVSILMHSFSNFGQRSCPVLSGHNLRHLFASYATLFIHTILYYAYYCITIPGRTANTNTTIVLLWQIPGAPLARSTSSRFLSVLLFSRQATMYCLTIILMENCQSLQSCSTAHGAIYDWRYLYMVLLLLFYYFIMKNVPGCKTTELNACSQLLYEFKNDTMNKQWCYMPWKVVISLSRRIYTYCPHSSDQSNSLFHLSIGFFF